MPDSRFDFDLNFSSSQQNIFYEAICHSLCRRPPPLYVSCYFHKVPPSTPPYSKPYSSFTLRLYFSCACCSSSLPFPLLFLHLACHSLHFNHHNLLLTPSYITLPSLHRFSRPLDSFFCHLPPPAPRFSLYFLPTTHRVLLITKVEQKKPELTRAKNAN